MFMNSKEETAEKYACYDSETGDFYATSFWLELLEILEPEDKKSFEQKYPAERIPLQEMVKYTQRKFLRKVGQRWALENYGNFDDSKKIQLNNLLSKFGVIEQQIPSSTDKFEYALFLGTSTANLCKRAFYIYDQIKSGHVCIENVVIMGNDEDYTQFLGSIKEIIKMYPEYFRDNLTVEQVPEKMTMHETMFFFA